MVACQPTKCGITKIFLRYYLAGFLIAARTNRMNAERSSAEIPFQRARPALELRTSISSGVTMAAAAKLAFFAAAERADFGVRDQRAILAFLAAAARLAFVDAILPTISPMSGERRGSRHSAFSKLMP